MVDPFVDPLDTAPVRRPPSPLQSHFMTGAEPAGNSGAFSRILDEKIQEKPTPLLTNEALQPPAGHGTGEPSGLPPQASFNPNTIPDAPPPPIHANSMEDPNQPAPGAEPSAVPPGNLAEWLHAAQPSGDVPQVLPGNEPESVLPPVPLSVTGTSPVLPSHESAETTDKIYTIARGDTLSHIVATSLNQQGIAYTNGELYQMVNVVARHNDIPDPNRIYAGNQLDLSPLNSETFLAKKEGVTKKEPDQQAWAAPVRNDETQAPAQGLVTSNFGIRVHPLLGSERFHQGIDIGVDTGTPIRSIQPGRVTFSGVKEGYGQVVQIDHGGGRQSLYAHLSERFVEEGTEVSPEDPIGLSGNSGRSTGPHLHFEIRQNGEAVNPLTLVALESIERPAHDDPVKLAQASRPRRVNA